MHGPPWLPRCVAICAEATPTRVNPWYTDILATTISALDNNCSTEYKPGRQHTFDRINSMRVETEEQQKTRGLVPNILYFGTQKSTGRRKLSGILSNGVLRHWSLEISSFSRGNTSLISHVIPYSGRIGPWWVF